MTEVMANMHKLQKKETERNTETSVDNKTGIKEVKPNVACNTCEFLFT